MPVLPLRPSTTRPFLHLAITFAVTLLALLPVLAKAQYAPYTPKVDFVAGFAARARPGIGVGLRVNPSPQLALTLDAEMGAWKREERLYIRDASVRSARAELRGGPSAFLGARYYARPDRVGFFVGGGFGVERYSVKAKSELVPLPQPDRVTPNSGSLGLDLLFALLSSSRPRVSNSSTATSSGSVMGLRAEIGTSIYAGPRTRVELGLGVRTRIIGDRSFDVGTRGATLPSPLSQFGASGVELSVRIATNF